MARANRRSRSWMYWSAEADGSQAMKLFREFDAWLDEKTGGSVDGVRERRGGRVDWAANYGTMSWKSSL